MRKRILCSGVALALTALLSSMSVGTARAATNTAQYSVNGQPSTFTPGGSASFTVTVTNVGSSTWQAGGPNPFHLGIHFISGNGTWLTDQRWTLPADLAPNQSTTINVRVTAPTTAGAYTLQEEMVQEGITWFWQHLDNSVSVGSSPAGPPLVAQYSVSGQPSSFPPGGSASYSVTLTNAGSATWQAGGSNPFHLGIHFVSGSGAWASDQRWVLPANLEPNQTVTIRVTVTAPTTAGTYTLQQEMVQEGVTWFWQHLDNTVSVGSSTSSSCPGSQSGCMQAMLNLLNADRAQAGVAPLALNMTQSNGTPSCVGSYGHSVHMAQLGGISHDQFPADICISYFTAGENVGEAGYGNELTDLQKMDSMMMAEPHTAATCATTVNHACNTLNSSFHQVGIGIYSANNTTWLTEDFTN